MRLDYRTQKLWYSSVPSSVAVFDGDAWQRTNQRPDHRMIMFPRSTCTRCHQCVVFCCLYGVCASCAQTIVSLLRPKSLGTSVRYTRGRDKHWLGGQAHVVGDRWRPYSEYSRVMMYRVDDDRNVRVGYSVGQILPFLLPCCLVAWRTEQPHRWTPVGSCNKPLLLCTSTLLLFNHIIWTWVVRTGYGKVLLPPFGTSPPFPVDVSDWLNWVHQEPTRDSQPPLIIF